MRLKMYKGVSNVTHQHHQPKIAVKDAQLRIGLMKKCWIVMLGKTLNKFCGCWRRRHGKGLPVINEVEGKTDDCDIQETRDNMYNQLLIHIIHHNT